MAKKIKTQKPKSGGGKASGGKSGGDARGKKAIRGMLIGAALIAAIAGFLLVPISGKTSFTHVIHFLGWEGSDETGPVKKAPKDAKTTHPEARPQGARPTPTPRAATLALTSPAPVPRARPARPAGLKVADNLRARGPMEKSSAEDDRALDRLVRQHLR